MKKTVNINLGGIIFHIDEDAFEKLNTYLSSIKLHYKDEEGCEEIASDIEARVAELLQDKNIEIIIYNYCLCVRSRFIKLVCCFRPFNISQCFFYNIDFVNRNFFYQIFEVNH